MSIYIRHVLCGLVFAGCSAAAIAANGDLDPSFGTGGFRRSGITDGGSSLPAGMGIQPDGKILLCNVEGAFPDSPSGNDIYVVRFTADGALDTSFSFDGRTTIDFGGNDDICSAIAVQSDGKIVVAGTTVPHGADNTDFAVARLNADGSLDTTTFGAGTGKAVFPFDIGGTKADTANGLALKADGKIVVAGAATTASNGTDFAILQLNTDGSRDTGFNLTGRVTVGFDLATSTTKNDIATRVAIDSQGRIVAIGNANHGTAGGDDFAAIRLLPNGQLDSDFSADGRATVAFDLGGAGGSNGDDAFSLTLQRDGKIVLAGLADSSTTSTPNQDMAIARLQPDGSLDTSFGLGGKTTIAYDLAPNAEDLVLGGVEQGNGKLVFAGAAFSGVSTLLAATLRLNADGTPDTSYGTLGKKTYDFAQGSPTQQLANGVVLQGTKIVFGGVLEVVDLEHIDCYVARVENDLIFADGFE